MVCSSMDRRRRGGIAVLTALLLVGLLGVAALVVDGGFLLSSRRYAQRVADEAALAGATQLMILQSGNAPQGTTTGQSAAQDLISNETGAASGLTYVSSTIKIGPSDSPVVPSKTICQGGDITMPLRKNYIEVIVVYQQKQYFSTIFGITTVKITGRAVARGGSGVSVDGILTLNPTAAGSLTISGGANLTVTGDSGSGTVAVIVNSNGTQGSSGAASTTGGSTVISPYLQTGDMSAASFPLVTTPITNAAPAPDPLRDLGTPSTNNLATATGNGKYKLNNNMTQPIYLTPGIYPKGIAIGGNANGNSTTDVGLIIMQPGVYYIQDNGFSVGSQATVVGEGVIIYNASPTGSNNGIQLGAQTTAYFTPLNSPNGLVTSWNSQPLGYAYNPSNAQWQDYNGEWSDFYGITFYSDRAAGNSVSLAGQGQWTNTGIVYAPTSDVKVTGGTGATIGSRYISSTLAISGSGNVYINYAAPPGKSDRILNLVE